MRYEVSAGGVVVRKNKGTWDVLLIKDMNGNWTFPKGRIEKGETPIVAAKREVSEEVGLTNLKLITALAPVKYVFSRGTLVKKIVYYFLFKYNGIKLPVGQKEEGISDIRWVSYPEAAKLIGYSKSNIPVLGQSEKIVSNL